MPSIATRGPKTKRSFPHAEVRRRLARQLQKAADESAILHEIWVPELDSLRVVSVELSLEDLFTFALPPEKLVRRGGYGNVEEGLDDILKRIIRLWKEHHS